jgi:hypothetical protein
VATGRACCWLEICELRSHAFNLRCLERALRPRLRASANENSPYLFVAVRVSADCAAYIRPTVASAHVLFSRIGICGGSTCARAMFLSQRYLFIVGKIEVNIHVNIFVRRKWQRSSTAERAEWPPRKEPSADEVNGGPSKKLIHRILSVDARTVRI